MNTVNALTGFSGFQLLTGQSPRIILLLAALPPSPVPTRDDDAIKQAMTILQKLEDDVQATKDNLLLTKVTQAHQKNKHWSLKKQYAVGNKVMLSTFHRQREYVQKGQNWVTKFMPRFDGPYTITWAFSICSVYAINVPNCPDLYSTFHTSLLKPFIANDPLLFPLWIQSQPNTVVTENSEEWFINQIVDERKRGRGYQYLVWWVGEGPEKELWLPQSELEDCEALDVWLKSVGCSWFHFFISSYFYFHSNFLFHKSLIFFPHLTLHTNLLKWGRV